MSYTTEQEAFWAGEFGREYTARNAGESLIASNIALFSRALGRVPKPSSCIEFGANAGMNLHALLTLFPGLDAHAVEINAAAVQELRKFVPASHVTEASMLEYVPDRTWDLVLVKGVLIHIDPEGLARAYDTLHAATGRWLLLCEYYNPTPTVVSYRGHERRLFKRDFCGEMLDRHPDLRLFDYGFVYHRDPAFPQDDATWFLLEKRSG